MEEKIAGMKAVREENRKKNNLKFLALAFLCPVYFVAPPGLAVIFSILFLLWIFYTIKRQNQERVRVFQAYQGRFLEQFKLWQNKVFPNSETMRLACGYLERQESFENVMVFRQGDEIIIKGLAFQKFFVYAVNNEFWYLFDMKRDGIPDWDRINIAKLPLEKWKENHQDFLRKKGIQWENLNIVEGYIYNRFLKQMLSGELIGRIAMDDGIDSLRKETLYFGRTPKGEYLYLTKEAVNMLGLKQLGGAYEN
mgnify:CR=1 FL=1